MSQNEELKKVNIPLNGKCRTAIDGTLLSEGDFKLLKNMRYGEVTPKSIAGMTKINTSIINATYFKSRGGFHFRKNQPSETHVITQAWNTGLTASYLYQNTTAIPSQGNFSATALWTDTSGASNGRFSDAPDGCMAYANGKDTCVWGGVEYRCAGFIVANLEATTLYDYTEKINNTLSDSANIATISTITGTGGLDANTLLMLHMDGTDGSTTFTDSSLTTPHTVTANGDAQIDTAQYKFATASGLFDGTGDYLTIPDNADFDLSAGTWSIDMQIRPTLTGGAATLMLYYQQTDADNYFEIYLSKTALERYTATIKVVAATVTVATLTSSNLGTLNNTWTHLEFTENGDNWYIFKNGTLVGQTSDASRAVDYTGSVYIGTDGAGTNPFKGWMDEYRLSNTPRHTSNFSAPTVAYSGTNNAYIYIASTRPLKGIKFYVGTANTSACVATISYWADSAWNVVSNFSDGTATAGVSLATTGTMSFDSTVSTAKVRMFNNIFAYWYLVTLPGIDTGTTVYYCTLDAPFQSIVDLWDGNQRYITAFYKYVTSFSDESTNVLEQDYLSGYALTYSDVSSLATTSYLVCGFAERMTGIEFTLVSGYENTDACNMSVYYWGGGDWVLTDGLVDGTKSDTDSFGQSGTVTWDAPSEASEFTRTVSGTDPWYYYKISFSATLAATTYLDWVTGIPAQKTILGYSYPVLWQNRVWLIDEASNKRNSARCSAMDTVCVFNGSDSTILYFGNEEKLTCGATLFTRFGGSVYDNLVVFKVKEVWIVDGTDPSTYAKYKISDSYGCIAPGTLKSCDTGYEIAPGITKHILIWQADKAVVMFDGNTVSPVSIDISNYFDENKAECIPASMKHKSEAFYDESNFEYHWLFASGTGQTTLNKEWVYDVLKKKWYEIDRGSGKYLQLGFPIRDTYGNNYSYGTIDTGYIERLDYGTNFDSNSIVSEFQIGDIPFGGYNVETAIRHIRLISKAKEQIVRGVKVTHYGDTIISTTSDEVDLGILDYKKRVVKSTKSVNWGNYIFHSLKFSLTTDKESCGFEPLGIGLMVKIGRESII